MMCAEAPRLGSQLDGKSRNSFSDVDFEERLKAVRRYTFFVTPLLFLIKTSNVNFCLFTHYSGQHLSRRR